MSMDKRVADSLARISQEAMDAADPFAWLVQEKLDELADKGLEEYPFIRYVYPTGCGTPSHLLIGTLAGYTESRKIMSDGALNNVVFKPHPEAVMYTRASNGWSFRMFRMPFQEGDKLRFWIHVDRGQGKKGDHPGSRRFYLARGDQVKHVTKEEYERA